jgi:iron(III) transport system permease protein
MVKSGILQIGKELEEAGRITGGSWLQMYFRVLFPILWPTIATVAILTFVISTRNVSHVALLATSDMRPLALLQLDYMIEGSLGSASIVGVIVMLLTILVALLIRKFGMRID